LEADRFADRFRKETEENKKFSTMEIEEKIDSLVSLVDNMGIPPPA
jgi:hypothetical protein